MGVGAESAATPGVHAGDAAQSAGDFTGFGEVGTEGAEVGGGSAEDAAEFGETHPCLRRMPQDAWNLPQTVREFRQGVRHLQIKLREIHFLPRQWVRILAK